LTSEDCDDTDPNAIRSGVSANCAAPSCLDILNQGNSSGSGDYYIDSDANGPKSPMLLYCDMDTDGGGWTRIANKEVGDTSTCGTNDLWNDVLSLTENWGAGGEVLSKYFNPASASSPIDSLKFGTGPYFGLYEMFDFQGLSNGGGWRYGNSTAFNITTLTSGVNYSNQMWWDDSQTHFCIGNPHQMCVYEPGTTCPSVYRHAGHVSSGTRYEIYVRE